MSFDAEQWDRQIERDAKTGRLNGLRDEALAWLKSIDIGYRDMGKDEAREREARKWAEDTSQESARRCTR